MKKKRKDRTRRKGLEKVGERKEGGMERGRRQNGATKERDRRGSGSGKTSLSLQKDLHGSELPAYTLFSCTVIAPIHLLLRPQIGIRQCQGSLQRPGPEVNV